MQQLLFFINLVEPPVFALCQRICSANKTRLAVYIYHGQLDIFCSKYEGKNTCKLELEILKTPVLSVKSVGSFYDHYTFTNLG